MTISLRRQGTLYVLSAPSGGGKSTVLKALLQRVPCIVYSMSVTSRIPRQGEADGKDYQFVTRAEFQQMIRNQDFYEWAEVHGNFYGTRKDTIDKILINGDDVLLDIDVQGAESVKAIKPASVTIFLLPPSIQTLENRLRGRATDTSDTIRLRLRNAAREIAESRKFDYLLINDVLEETVAQVEHIILAERSRCERQDLIVKDEPIFDKLRG